MPTCMEKVKKGRKEVPCAFPGPWLFAPLQDKWNRRGITQGRSLFLSLSLSSSRVSSLVSVRVCVCARTHVHACVFGRPFFVRTSWLDDLQLTEAFWAASAWARFPLSHANNGGFEATLGISSDCKHCLFSRDSRLKMDLVFWEVLCRYSWNLIPHQPPSVASPSCYCWGDFSARVCSIIVGFIIGAPLSICQVCFSRFPPFFLTLQIPPAWEVRRRQCLPFVFLTFLKYSPICCSSPTLWHTALVSKQGVLRPFFFSLMRMSPLMCKVQNTNKNFDFTHCWTQKCACVKK